MALSYLSNSEINAIDELYAQYQKNPDSIDLSWRKFFEGFEFAIDNNYSPLVSSETLDKEFKVNELIDAYRKRGHLFTKTNPVRMRRSYSPTLDIENYNLNESDLDTEFFAGKELGLGKTTLRSIEDYLKATYCESIGAEYMFIRDPERLNWLIQRIEANKNKATFSNEEKKEIFTHLKKAVGFEIFIHKKFIGQKRFSLEGAENLVPGLIAAIDYGAQMGIEEYPIGMSHRGRLNILTNILQKPYERTFKEFEGDEYEEGITLGDVKYHLGFDNHIKTSSGKSVRISIAPNPSHLEAVGSIIQGIARSRINHAYNGDMKKVLPICIHGDAAIAAQGIVYEVIQMSELQGYKTGGTLHLVINNQVGFTTNYLDARSSTYCTDIAKVTKSPIFHVNGDDVEALLHTLKIAIDYRQTFHSDVFIDILCYRKYGHNEGDEPRFTQPLLYKAIAVHPNPRDIYSEQLISQGIFTNEEIQKSLSDFDSMLEEKLSRARESKVVNIPQFLKEDWKDFKFANQNDFRENIQTGIKKSKLIDLAAKITKLPENKNFFKKILKLFEDRNRMVKENKIDWAMAELLAYASLLDDGHPIRISGQDSVRGTFSHRHAAVVIEDTDQQYIPLKHLKENQPSFEIYNSLLSEYGVLGFEYGYAMASPLSLTIWEAQFGDFMNVAQVIVDQYISSAEEKWGLMNGLVLYLPHGYEGQGSEHSSARMERFLNMAARNNMMIVNPTTPSNFFHLLRVHMKRKFRLPLIIFTPKSLLRHPKCISSLDELEKNYFQDVIDDTEVDVKEVRRLVFCTGKIFYDLLEKKEEFNARDIAIVRIEQLHPFPLEKIEKILKKYKNKLLTLWVQEEPENMGAWYYIRNNLSKHNLISVTRLPSGSPAVGLHNIHEIQQKEIIDKVFRKCDCSLKNKYCGLQCVVGSSRKEILKQHYYFQKD